MQRPGDSHLVLIDFGLSERRDQSYVESLPALEFPTHTCQILTASDSLPTKGVVSASYCS
jgi:hypothetical protein